MATPPVVPPDYTLEQTLKGVPAFLQSQVPTTKIKVEPENDQYLASVSPATPRTVDVYGADNYTPPVAAHEETHIFQLSRNLNVLADNLWSVLKGSLNKNYDYGGPDGLLAAQRQHKTIADFGLEQQANMVADFQDETKKAIATGDTALLDKINRAYGPFIHQLANLPGRGESMTTMTQRDLTPAPPGLPPSSETGIMEPDPLIGGSMRVIQQQPFARQRQPIDTYANPEDEPRNVSFERNKNWIKPGPYVTKLSPQDEAEFQSWAKQNPELVKGELDTPTPDYDVRGRWLAEKHGDPEAKLIRSEFDGRLHASDKWKTPYDAVFSAESIYAKPNAPKWVGDRLIDMHGRVIADETPRKKKPAPPAGYTLEK